MRTTFGVSLLLSAMAANAAFIHPMDFDGSEAQKQEVIEYIQTNVKTDYCEGIVDMCQDTTLRMMEKSNLSAFKQLTTAKNRKIMDVVIRDYCDSDIGLCSYSTINMMYNQNLKASNEELSW